MMTTQSDTTGNKKPTEKNCECLLVIRKHAQAKKIKKSIARGLIGWGETFKKPYQNNNNYIRREEMKT